MVVQMNLKFQDKFFDLAKQYADERGYMSMQELVRDALREKIYDDLEVREQYIAKLDKIVGNDEFLSVKESKQVIEDLKRRSEL